MNKKQPWAHIQMDVTLGPEDQRRSTGWVDEYPDLRFEFAASPITGERSYLTVTGPIHEVVRLLNIELEIDPPTIGEQLMDLEI